jgi:5'-3' exonuclease
MTNETFLLIDTSYLIFYRIFAIKSWFNRAYPDDEITDPILNETFMEKYDKLFISSIEKVIKNMKFNIPISNWIFAQDCACEKSIWRYELFPEYKDGRIDNTLIAKNIFKHTYENILKDFCIENQCKMIGVDKCEADDIIAVLTNYYLNKNKKVIILANDHDYFQLLKNSDVKIINLQNKLLNEKSTGEDLMMKILIGDKSDNIPPAFKKCGIKTAEKLIKDSELLEEKLEKEGREQYELNKKLIDFNEIPNIYKQQIINKFLNY